MRVRRSWLVWLGIVAGPVLLGGCQQSGQMASTAVAKATLCQALDAWKQGEPQNAFKARSAVTVVERKWQGGARLLNYEVVGDGGYEGFDWVCKVKLQLQDAAGKKSQEKAAYFIATAPALVIVRSES